MNSRNFILSKGELTFSLVIHNEGSIIQDNAEKNHHPEDGEYLEFSIQKCCKGLAIDYIQEID